MTSTANTKSRRGLFARRGRRPGDDASLRAKRYASVDLLRGGSILAMLVLHTVNDTLDVNAYIDKLGSVGMINLAALFTLPYLGGLAGLFLMTSAIGNMIAMSRNLEKGHAPFAIAKKQVIGGLLIVLFAMFAEAILGYHGAVGSVMRNLHDVSEANYSSMYTRAYVIETLHTIGWAEVINGIVHGVLVTRFDAARDANVIIRVYWVLAALVVALTPAVWFLTSWLVPGYPFEINPETGQAMFLPVVGTSPWYDFLLYFFANPLAAPMEPIFPYLATSFVGSIVGLQLVKKADRFDRSFVRRYFCLGACFFVVGLAGIVVLMMRVVSADGFVSMTALYRQLSDHRHFAAERMPSGWLWQYLALNGTGLMIVALTLRLVEYRGQAGVVARRFAFVRRFGFIAFTIYIIQWVYFIVHFLVTRALGLEPYARLPWLGTWTVVILALLTLHVVMLLWERNGYLASMEWAVLTCTHRLTSIKKAVATGGEKSHWYDYGRLNVAGSFSDPAWQNFPLDNQPADERRLIRYAALGGFLFPPLSFFAYAQARSFDRRHPQQNLSRLKLASIAGMALFLVWLTFALLVSPADMGIAL